MPVTVSIDQRAVTAFLTGAQGPVVRGVADVCRRVANEGKRRCPVDEGRLRASIDWAVTTHGTTILGTVGTDVDYAVYVHEGTGLYGPRKRLIRPVSARALSWVPRTGGQGSRTGGQGSRTGGRKTARETRRVTVRYTRGMRPRPFLREALEAVSPWPVTRTPG